MERVALYLQDAHDLRMDLITRGLRLVRHFWHMRIDLPAEFDAGRPPDGIAIRTPDMPHDLPAVYAVLDRAFADHWDHPHEPFERWLEDNAQGPAYDPDLWFVAWDEERPVGALTAVLRDESGWVSLLGVRAESRGRGIATALLHSAFAAFAARGVRSVLLVVDAESLTGATALYESVGMSVAKRFDVWERALDPRRRSTRGGVSSARPACQGGPASLARLRPGRHPPLAPLRRSALRSRALPGRRRRRLAAPCR